MADWFNGRKLWPCLGCIWFERSVFDTDAVRHCYMCEEDPDGNMTQYVAEDIYEEE